ncbi:hypothetical protein HPT27_08050 [Permianibacter sp. IMCC34836]|uniref:hypothetical protein n=1 Tax=Permianibacter fluminis TaxID=2738515 RepID=UPI001551E4FD|nr:hypothetical protein [Permianibacter fluminis]NQD36974.1 hypothetical protein [Permianibacter fluminis]
MYGRLNLLATILLTAILFSPPSRAADTHFAFELGFIEPTELAGLSLRGAWSPIRYLSAELGFQDLAVNRDGNHMANHREDDASAFTGSLRLDLPLTKSAGIFARAGYAAWSADYDYASGAETRTAEASGVDPFHEVGIYWEAEAGLQFNMSVRTMTGLPDDDFASTSNTARDFTATADQRDFLISARYHF